MLRNLFHIQVTVVAMGLRFQCLPVLSERVRPAGYQLLDRSAVAGTCPAAGSRSLTDRQESLPETRNRTSLNSILRPPVLRSMAAAAAAFQNRSTTAPRRPSM
jgi:hypothetical protein